MQELCYVGIHLTQPSSIVRNQHDQNPGRGVAQNGFVATPPWLAIALLGDGGSVGVKRR